jgi:hypothetical protein
VRARGTLETTRIVKPRIQSANLAGIRPRHDSSA